MWLQRMIALYKQSCHGSDLWVPLTFCAYLACVFALWGATFLNNWLFGAFIIVLMFPCWAAAGLLYLAVSFGTLLVAYRQRTEHTHRRALRTISLLVAAIGITVLCSFNTGPMIEHRQHKAITADALRKGQSAHVTRSLSSFVEITPYRYYLACFYAASAGSHNNPEMAVAADRLEESFARYLRKNFAGRTVHIKGPLEEAGSNDESINGKTVRIYDFYAQDIIIDGRSLAQQFCPQNTAY